MSFDDKKGIVVASGFKLQAETMLDARQQVDTIQERDELVTINAATPGLRVYVKNEKKSYVYNGTGWDLLTTGAGYIHPTGDGYHHVPATGTTNNGKFLKSGSTAGSENWQNIKTSDIIDFPTSLPTKNNMVVKFNGGTTEGTNQFTFNGSAAKTVNITPAAIGAATSNHTHTPASIGAAASDHNHTSEDITDFDDAVEALLPSIPTKLPNPQGLTISFNGTSQGAYDGSAAKSINITPASIGAATSGHTHTHKSITDFDDAVGDLIPAIPTKLPNPQVLKFTGAVNDSYDGSVAKTINIPTTGSTDGSLVVQLNGGTSEDTNKFTFNGSDDKTVNITPAGIGAAAASHTHNYAGSSSAGGAANSVKTSLVVKLNGGTTEGTNMFTFNGSAAKSINITPSSIGAAAASHNHTHANITDFDDAVEALLPSIPTKLPNPQGLTISLNGTSQGAYDGSAAKSVNITPSGIGAAAASHTHTSANISDFDEAVGDLIPAIPTKLPNPQVLKFTGAVNDTYDGSVAKTINIPTSGSTDGSLIVQLNGGTTEDTNKFTFNGSDDKTVNITPSKIGAAASSHTHNYAGSSSAGGAANSVKTSLVIKLNGGTTEGTNMFTFNGANAKSINITPAAIGAAASSHTHNYAGSSSAGGAATSANKLNTTILTNQNLNDYHSGVNFYSGAGGNTCTNKPSGVDNFGMFVFQTAGGWWTQMLYGSDDDLYTRRWNGTNWSSWSKVYTTTNKPTASDIGAAASSHTHNYAGSSSAGGAANSVKTSLVIKLNGGSTEGTNMFTFNGAAAKSINITPSAIGAAASSHTHTATQVTGLAASRALVSNASGQVAVSAVTATELGYLDGVTSAIQTQLNNKAASSHTHNYAGSSSAGGAANSALKVNVPVGTVLFSTSNSTTFFNACFGGTWTIVGNVVANIDAASGADSTLTLYMFRKTAA